MTLEIADVYQHDLADNAAAIVHYQQALGSLQELAPLSSGGSTLFRNWWARWLEHEIHYLQTGEPFSGTLGRADVAWAFPAVLGYGAPATGGVPVLDELLRSAAAPANAPTDRDQLQRTLQTLPHSHRILATALPLLGLLPADAIVSFLTAQDPARYWSASVLGTIVLEARFMPAGSTDRLFGFFPPDALRATAGEPPPLLTAADRFARETGIRFVLDPDPRFGSPEQTWTLFLAALKRGDAQGALSCFTADFRRKLEPVLAHTPAASLQAMAASFVSFAPAADRREFHDYEIIALRNGQRYSFSVSFADDAGEWKICRM